MTKYLFNNLKSAKWSYIYYYNRQGNEKLAVKGSMLHFLRIPQHKLYIKGLKLLIKDYTK